MVILTKKLLKLAIVLRCTLFLDFGESILNPVCNIYVIENG